MRAGIEKIDYPCLAIMQHKILVLAYEAGDLERATDAYFQLEGLPREHTPSPPWHQVQLLSLMYLIFVYPKEIMKGSLIEKEVVKLVESNIDGNTHKKIGDVNALYKKVRNAVAHASFTLTEKGGVSFYDQKTEPKHGSELTLSAAEFNELIRVFADAFFKLRRNEDHRKNLRSSSQ